MTIGTARQAQSVSIGASKHREERKPTHDLDSQACGATRKEGLCRVLSNYALRVSKVEAGWHCSDGQATNQPSHRHACRKPEESLPRLHAVAVAHVASRPCVVVAAAV